MRRRESRASARHVARRFSRYLARLILAEAIEDPPSGTPPLRADLDAPVRRSISRRLECASGFDAHHGSLSRRAVSCPAPIEIKPPRVGVDFDGNAMLGAGRQHSLDVDFVPRPPQELPPGHMAEDGGVRIGDGAEDALGLRLAIKFEASVDAGDHKVE